MNKKEIITLTRTKVGEDNTNAELSDTHLSTMLQARNQDVCNAIISTNELYFGAIDQTIDLVNGTASYALPDLDDNDRTRVSRILRLEISYDGSTYYKATPVKVQDIPTTTYIDTAYSTLTPAYYILGNTLYFLPTPTENQTNAVKIWYIRRQLDLTNDSDIPQFPEQYHHILASGVAADVMKRSGSPVLDLDDTAFADRFEAEYKDGLSSLLETITPRDISTPEYVVDEDDFFVSQIDYESRSSIT